jgi:hypothetical protein
MASPEGETASAGFSEAQVRTLSGLMQGMIDKALQDRGQGEATGGAGKGEVSETASTSKGTPGKPGSGGSRGRAGTRTLSKSSRGGRAAARQAEGQPGPVSLGGGGGTQGATNSTGSGRQVTPGSKVMVPSGEVGYQPPKTCLLHVYKTVPYTRLYTTCAI